MTTATNVTINSAAELDLDTLDAVAGSSIRETSEDIDALRRAGYLNEEFGCLLFHCKKRLCQGRRSLGPRRRALLH